MEVHYSLESSKVQEIRMSTRLEAVQIAHEKAIAMANELDAKVGPVLRLEEKSDHGYGHLANSMTYAEFGQIDHLSNTFVPGNIEVSVSVFATFSLN